MSNADPIVVQVEDIGEVKLAPAKAIMSAMIAKPEMTDSVFFKWLLRLHLIEPKEIDNQDISDKTLNNIFYQWADKSDIQLSPESDNSLESLRHDIESHISAIIQQALKPMQETIDKIHHQTSWIAESLPDLKLDFPSISVDFLDSIPTFRDFATPALSLFESDISARIVHTYENIFDKTISKLIEEGQKSHEALGESEYGFAIEFIIQLCSLDVIGQFRSAHKLPEDEILKDFESVVKFPEFEERFYKPFLELDFLQTRIKIIETAYQLHKDRNYIACIPLFLTQIEFLLRLLLEVRNKITIQNGKIYVLKDGKIKKNKKEKPIQLHGLGDLLQNSDLDGDESLDKLASFMSDTLVATRNGILHGSNAVYGTSKLSIQCILNIFVLSQVLYSIDEL